VRTTATLLIVGALLVACGGGSPSEANPQATATRFLELPQATLTPVATNHPADEGATHSAEPAPTPMPTITLAPTPTPETEALCDIALAGKLAGRSSVQRIYCVAADGTDIRPLTSLPDTAFNTNALEVFPAWSPDGRQIAFSRTGADGGVFIVEADGSNERRITGGWASEISWSPDGSRLVLSWLEQGHTPESFDQPTQLVMLDADGSNRRDISDLIGRPNEEVYDFRPAWSPDGTRILFQRFGPFTSEIYIVTTDEFDLQQVETGDLNVFYSSPAIAWIPDSRSVAIHGSAPDAPEVSSIFRVSLTGEAPERLTPVGLPLLAGLPAWASDGSRLAYGSARDGTMVVPSDALMELDLFIVDIHSGVVQQVTDTPEVLEAAVDWSPDDTKLLHFAFPPDDETNNDGSIESISLRVVDVDDLSVVTLVDDFSMESPYESRPVWRPARE
jgi:Tol biopolymer transport system component